MLTLRSLDVVKDTSLIVFNAAKLDLRSARVSSASLKQEIIQESSVFAFDEETERATIELPAALVADTKVVAKIDFDGDLTGSMLGYYRSAYEVNGKTEHYSLTQFEVRSDSSLSVSALIVSRSPRQHAEPSLAGTNPSSKRPSP